jgi:peptidoglycan hydrolase-like protein with peptidoglycan-binding domain
MNYQQEVIFRKALQSQNPQAILSVAQAFSDLGEPMIANTLKRLAKSLWGKSVSHSQPQAVAFGGAGDMYSQAQEKLNELGAASPPLKVDGLWGPKSKTALMAFQKANPPLTIDGILGPKSCAALGITYSASSTGAATPGGRADAAAYAVAKNANAELGLTEAEIQYVLAVARGEGFYGNGWSPSASTIAISEKFGLTGYEGVGSNNWGAEQGSGDAGSFPHVDHHADGSAYVGNYKKWSSPEKGYASIAKTVLSGLKRGAAGAQEIRAAINKGNLHDAVYAQRANGYFELAADKYLSGVIRNYNAIGNAVGWPKLLSETGITPTVATIATGGTGVLLMLLAGGLFLFRKRIFN